MTPLSAVFGIAVVAVIAIGIVAVVAMIKPGTSIDLDAEKRRLRIAREKPRRLPRHAAPPPRDLDPPERSDPRQ